MKILYQVNTQTGLGADRWIGNGFKDAFEDLGHQFFWFDYSDDFSERLKEVGPDILMISQDAFSRKNLSALNNFRKSGGKVAVQVDSFFDKDREVADALKHHDPADLYYGEVEHPFMDRFMSETGKKYHIITNAAHHRWNKPGIFKEKYACDIAFLGAYLPLKREMFEKLLFPLQEKHNVKVFGPMWTKRDNAMRVLASGSRKFGLTRLNNWINKRRISVPREDEPDFYSSAKICINIHERTEEIKTHVILNERTFKIPACGGFEICDYVPPLRNYFSEQEMVMAEPNNGDWIRDWHDKIEYYLAHEDERRAIQKRGTERALRDHTYIQRVERLINLLYPES